MPQLLRAHEMMEYVYNVADVAYPVSIESVPMAGREGIRFRFLRPYTGQAIPPTAGMWRRRCWRYRRIARRESWCRDRPRREVPSTLLATTALSKPLD